MTMTVRDAIAVLSECKLDAVLAYKDPNFGGIYDVVAVDKDIFEEVDSTVLISFPFETPLEQ